MARKSSKVEALYELCQNMFTPSGSPPPSSAAINKLFLFWAQCLRLMLGLKRKIWMMIETMDIFGLDQLNRVARWAQPITYLDIYIYECDSFTMCIFGFPTFSVIPLLDHPGMTVFSKVLYGSLHVRAYDWVEPPRKARNEITFQVWFFM
ncbi:PREDICTED: plant cysteine [Prunus dulcis]|uniref:cysteine dioxygenase n=1 Tax=Prunus dulcis TaxID=3755 RepID=A0A5E4EKM0_PRUDU|nr:PREDICTED: plant cysteine [Prunus dulcis]